jgi:RimJ/RimL family protein N-acetyltransferase
MLRLETQPYQPVADDTYLEPITPDDADRLLSVVRDNQPYLRQYMNWTEDFSRAKALMACHGIARLYSTGQASVYKIVDENQYSGHVGVYRNDKTDDFELFYWLARAKQGRGLASRSARVVRDDAFRQGVTSLSLKINPKNSRSQAVARRLEAERRTSPARAGVARLMPRVIAAELPETWVINSQVLKR